MGYKFRVTIFIETISTATAQKILQQQQQQQKVSSYPFVSLSRVCNGLCRTLYISPLRSCVLLCVPVCSLCIQIGLCWKLFFNRVLSCAFAMALNFLKAQLLIFSHPLKILNLFLPFQYAT